MTFSHLGFPLRILLPLLLTLSSPLLAQGSGLGGATPSPLTTGLIAADDFDDQVHTEALWELSRGSWSVHFIDDGSGGYALNFFDAHDNGGGQDSNPDAGATLPPPIETGGGGFDSTYYAEGYFSFDMALYANPVLEHGQSPRMDIFVLQGPDLRLEMRHYGGTWSYRLKDHINPVTAWQDLPAGTTACHVEIQVVAGDATQTGRFSVTFTDTAGHGWALTSTVYQPTYEYWHALFLGMKTPKDESYVPPALPPGTDSGWLTAIAYDNFFAYSEQQSSWGGY